MRPERGRQVRRWGGPARIAVWTASALTATVLCTLIVAPGAHGAARFAVRLVDAARTLSRHAPKARPPHRESHAFAGTPAVGALFSISGDRLGSHFCTASVVDSPVRDLVITAAHCVSKTPAAGIAFVPGYHGGQAPYGVWQVTRVIVNSAWRTGANPDDDVAFLVVRNPGSPAPIQDLTGGNRLGTGWPAREWVTVTGYPNSGSRPITCGAWTHPFGSTQLRFDCGGYTDGTSGAPFITHASRNSGDGTVIGVIGGYAQGGNIAPVSYSARFAAAVRALYHTAVALGSGG